ncbi:hypothetical protein Tco_0367433 [Tanacetum coccineum]
MTQGPGASRTVPQKRKQSKPKRGTVIAKKDQHVVQARCKNTIKECPARGIWIKTSLFFLGPNIPSLRLGENRHSELGYNDQHADKGLPSTFPDKDTGKITPLSEGLLELDFKPLRLTTTTDIQALLGASDDDLKKDSEDDMFEAGEEMDEYIQELDTEETQTHPSTKHTTEEHQSPSSNRDQPESSKAKKTKASDSESSSYFINTSFTKYDNTDATLRNFQQILSLFNVDHNTCLKRILDNLKEVQDAFKEDIALNKKVLEAIKAYTKNSTNLTKLLTLAKNFNFSGLKSLVETLKSIVDAQNDHLAT